MGWEGNTHDVTKCPKCGALTNTIREVSNLKKGFQYREYKLVCKSCGNEFQKGDK